MTKEELCSLIDRERLVSDYGKTTVDRALEYVGKVQKMRLCPDGSVLATINGSASYVTRVKVKEDGGFDDQCTCPVGYGCKHAVALALAWNKKNAFEQGSTLHDLSSWAREGVGVYGRVCLRREILTLRHRCGLLTLRYCVGGGLKVVFIA